MLLENLVRQAFRHHAARRRVEDKRRRVRGSQPVIQPVEPKICDRRHVNHNFGHHHKHDRQQKQLAGESDARLSRSRLRFDHAFWFIGPIPISPQPKILIQPMMRRAQTPVKLGVK